MSNRIGTSSSQTKSSFNEDRCLSPIGLASRQHQRSPQPVEAYLPTFSHASRTFS